MSRIHPTSDRTGEHPLSSAQYALWFLQHLEPDNISNHLPICWRLEGRLDRVALQKSINEIIKRHSVLRTSFSAQEGQPSQVIKSALELELDVVDLQSFPRSRVKLEIQRITRDEIQRPFDLSEIPLFRIKLLQLAEEEHIFLLTMHQLISDSISQRVFFRELGKLYSTIVAGNSPTLPDLNLQYIDYAIGQRKSLQNKEWKTQLSYWKKKLAGDLPVLELPIDRPRPLAQTFRGSRRFLSIPSFQYNALLALSQTEGCSLFMTILAALGTILHRYTGQSDILIGSPIPNRDRFNTERLIGQCFDMLVFRTDVRNNPKFVDLMQRVREVTLGAFSNPDIPFHQLVEEIQPLRDPSRNPIFQVMLEITPTPVLELPNLTVSQLEVESGGAQFDLAFHLFESPERLTGYIEYNTDLFDSSTVDRMIGHFQTAIEGILADPRQVISQIPILSEAEKDQFLRWNDTLVKYPDNRSIPQLFEEQVRQTPDAPAIIFENQQLTFAQLNDKATQLAKYLKTFGVGAQDRVGICIERSPEMVAGLLGILKCGGAYIPLDPSSPQERLSYMLKDSGVKFVVSNKKCGTLLNNLIGDLNIVLLEEIENERNFNGSDLPEWVSISGGGEVAYIIYTSGSTGKPKGVQGTTKGLLNRLSWMWNEYPYDSKDVCCQKASLNFVDHIAEIFSPLLKGIPLVILKNSDVRDVDQMIEILVGKQVTRIVLVPSLLRSILYEDKKKLSKLNQLRYWFCSGEPLTVNLAKSFYEKIPNGVLFNIYGSAEVGADVTCYKLEQKNLNSLMNYFSPNQDIEDSNLTLSKNSEFLGSITTPKIALTELRKNFTDTHLPEYPVSIEEYNESLSQNVIPYIVNTASPRFIGHMTSALPSFAHDLSNLISRLNQNTVKVETSKALTFIERQTIAMLHREYFSRRREFYDAHVQNPNSGLGVIVSGGTLANVTALWCARNLALPPDSEFGGIADAGLLSSLEYYNYKGIALISTLSAHYSVKKAASLLGIGEKNIVYVDQTKDGILDISSLKKCIQDCQKRGVLIVAMVGVAGTTESGLIDPLEDMGEVAEEFGIYFHVDAAWGGPVIFSKKYKSLLKGIERADSITICGHKQLYLPQGISLCLFRKPSYMDHIATSAYYQAAKESFDFGKNSPEGSRPALSLILHAAFSLIGRAGYEKLIDEGINKAQYVRKKICESEALELIGESKLNIVNYRYIPKDYRKRLKNGSLEAADNLIINDENTKLQERQFYEGESFVSKTTLVNTRYGFGVKIVVMRVVLANPLTTYQDIDFVFQNQLEIADKIIEKESGVLGSKGNHDRELHTSDSINRDWQDIDSKNLNPDDIFENKTVPIGRPIANTRIYILDRALNLLPIGITGEIFVTGEGLAAGYLNRPELTDDKFIPDPFSKDDPNSRLYQTGDLGCYRNEGNIEFLGRRDFQVKIRGNRIELGEIESVLIEHPNLRDVVVIVREDDPGDKHLVAYLVPKKKSELNIGELRSSLEEKLPEYMLPNFFVVLKTLPLTSNCKVDRLALPTPDHKCRVNKEDETPMNQIEKDLAVIWENLLQVDKVGINDNFFEIGGNSFLVLTFIAQAKKVSMHLTAREVFLHPTIAGLASKAVWTGKSPTNIL